MKALSTLFVHLAFGEFILAIAVASLEAMTNIFSRDNISHKYS